MSKEELDRTPPWVKDGHPEQWFPVAVAARFYFRRTPTTVKVMIKNGTMRDIHKIESYWDGKRWYVRLPTLSSAQRIAKIANSERRRA